MLFKKNSNPTIVYLLAIEDIVQSPLLHSQVFALLKIMAAQAPERVFHVVALYPVHNALRFRAQISALRADLRAAGITLHVLPILFATRYFYIPKNLLPLFFAQGWLAAQWIVRQLQPAVIHCRSYPATWVGMQVKRRCGARLICDTRALYPEEGATLEEGGKSVLLDAASFAEWKRLERTMFTASDAITAVSQPSIDILATQYPHDAARMHVIPTTTRTPEHATLADWQPQTRQELGLPAARIAVYAGSWFEPEPMADLIHRLLAADPHAPWHFLLLVAPQAAAAAIAAMAMLELTANATVLSVPQPEVLRYLAGADLALQPVGAPHQEQVDPRYTLTARTRLSIKLTEYLAGGLPVLVSCWAGAAADLVQQHDLGLVYDEAPPDALAAWLTRWRAAREDFRRRAWDFARTNFAIEEVARRYLALYRGEDEL
ncbi:MAG: glycosyltransferase [Anaerolineae bacterium]|nr:glycosyltransferase [Anaerolineae bacterium]